MIKSWFQRPEHKLSHVRNQQVGLQLSLYTFVQCWDHLGFIWTSAWSPTDGSLWTFEKCDFDFFFFLFFFLWYPQGLLLSGHFSLITHHHKYVACCRENTAQPLTVQPNKTVCNGCGSARHSGFVNKKMSSIFTNVIWTTFNYYHLLTKLPCSCHREAVKLVVSVVLKMGAQTICSRTVNINFSCFFFLQCATVG